MTDEEAKELEMLEGPVKSLTQKPLKDMTDQELQDFVSSLRDCTTTFQTMIANARVGKAEKPDVNAELFE